MRGEAWKSGSNQHHTPAPDATSFLSVLHLGLDTSPPICPFCGSFLTPLLPQLLCTNRPFSTPPFQPPLAKKLPGSQPWFATHPKWQSPTTVPASEWGKRPTFVRRLKNAPHASACSTRSAEYQRSSADTGFWNNLSDYLSGIPSTAHNLPDWHKCPHTAWLLLLCLSFFQESLLPFFASELLFPRSSSFQEYRSPSPCALSFSASLSLCCLALSLCSLLLCLPLTLLTLQE